MTSTELVIAGPDLRSGFSAWESINDRVMGGVSDGSLRSDPTGVAFFEGCVRLEFGGGFASVRRAFAPPIDASQFDAIFINACGDDKVFKLRLRNQDSPDAVAFEAEFRPPREQFGIIQLALNSFCGVFRGRKLGNDYILDRTRITSIGLMISGKQTGPFRLGLREIGLK